MFGIVPPSIDNSGEHMLYAFDHGCDLAMTVAGVGRESQRNAEHKGFRIAYTRTKWRFSY